MATDGRVVRTWVASQRHVFVTCAMPRTADRSLGGVVVRSLEDTFFGFLRRVGAGEVPDMLALLCFASCFAMLGRLPGVSAPLELGTLCSALVGNASLRIEPAGHLQSLRNAPRAAGRTLPGATQRRQKTAKHSIAKQSKKHIGGPP